MTLKHTKKDVNCKVGKDKKNKDFELVELELSDLEKAIQFLAQNPNLDIDDLPKNPELHKAFKTVKLSISLLYDTKQYPLIVDIVKKQQKPENIQIGTVGSFLFGCLQEDYGDVDNKLCSILCVKNLPPTKSDSLKMCEVSIWRKDESGLKKVAESLSKRKVLHAYVFVHDNFSGFSADEIQKLKNDHITMVKLFQTVNSKHFVILELTPVDKLPLIDLLPVSPTGPANLSRARLFGINGFIWWALIIVIIVVVIIFLMRRRR